MEVHLYWVRRKGASSLKFRSSLYVYGRLAETPSAMRRQGQLQQKEDISRTMIRPRSSQGVPHEIAMRRCSLPPGLRVLCKSGSSIESRRPRRGRRGRSYRIATMCQGMLQHASVTSARRSYVMNCDNHNEPIGTPKRFSVSRTCLDWTAQTHFFTISSSQPHYGAT
jgi:hypothetical protein